MTVTATGAAGKELIGVIQVFEVSAALLYPAVGVSGGSSSTGEGRPTVITDPPSDLQLDWNPSVLSVDFVQIVLAVFAADGTVEDLAVLGDQSNTGAYLITSSTLEAFDLATDALVVFKVRAALFTGTPRVIQSFLVRN